MKTLIFIDDDPISNYIHDLVLENLKIKNAHFFLSAKEGLDFLSNRKNQVNDIIFVDINMPVMDGWDFIEKYQNLYKSNKNNQQFFVMLSSSFNHNYTKKIKKYKSIKGFLIKPLSKDTLTNFFQEHNLL